MRLEGQTKLGYFPTPDVTLSLIPTWLNTSEEGRRRYLDPCCGTGEALAHIADGQAETYGIELSDVRAKVAEDRLAHVINTAYEYAQLTDETFSLILLNPPYDGESATGGGKRMEETFLIDRGTTGLLVPGGILIYLIPHNRLNEGIARHLAGWYADLRCFKLPAGEYEAFRQVIIFGMRRADYTTPKGETLSDVLAWRNGQRFAGYVEETAATQDAGGEPKMKKSRRPVFEPLPELIAGSSDYSVPVSPLKGKRGATFRWQYVAVSDDDYLREADDAATRLDASREWCDLFPRIKPPLIEPAMTPKKGHIAMQVSGGLLGTNCVRTPSGDSLLLKGNVTKYTVTRHEVLESEDDEETMVKVQTEERFKTLLSTLDADGSPVTHEDPVEIGRLLEQYVEQLAEIVQARNVPQYDLKPEAWEWAIFDSLSRGRQLPGRDETGLTDFQKHLAIALGRLCLKHGAGFANSEMGTGKTTIGIAIAEYVHTTQKQRGKASAYPALVVGPGIVTGKENWPREIAEVTPGAESRVITIGAKPLPKPMKIGVWLKDQVGLTLDDEAFEGLDASRCLALVTREAKRQKKLIAAETLAALNQSLKRAWSNPPHRRRGANAPNLLDGRIGGFLWLGADVQRDEEGAKEYVREYSVAQFVAEYTNGQLPEKSFAILSFETAKLASGRLPAMNTAWRRVLMSDADGESTWVELKQVCVCPECGQPVAEKYDAVTGEPDMVTLILSERAEQFVGTKRRFCQAPLRYFDERQGRHLAGKRMFDPETGKHVFRAKDEDDQVYVCGAPLFEVSSLRRVAAADYIKKKARRVFGLCLVDEVHKAKAKGTGVGWALTVLNNAARWTVGLTGTLFDGYSTSIFWLLYRLAPDVRREFGFDDERRWTEKYGLLKRQFYMEREPAEDGAFTGTKFFETVSEKPGISPAITGVGLKYCTFSSLKDVGLPLPDYSEEIVHLRMTEVMAEQYADADGSQTDPVSGLLEWALDTQKEGDGTGKGAISVWLNTALHRPDAMFRPEEVWFNRRLRGKGKWAVRQKEHVRSYTPACKATLDSEAGEWLGDWLPKEQWAADTCWNERQCGRKILIYLKQTGERDIQPRVKAALESRGLRVGILKPSIAPEKRATWLKRHAESFDVLLTNAKLIEVGLNLTMFSTAIFFELEFSLYVTWQAMRRLYRPGAPKPVKLYFPVYAGTLAEAALDLIGAKMMAAQCFYGDEVGGALVDEGDEGDLLNDLVRKALGQIEVGRAERLFAIGNNQMATESPLGSPTAVSPLMRTLAELAARRRELVSARRRVRSVATVGESQLSLL
jgi:SAM-dependent methyltransferase